MKACGGLWQISRNWSFVRGGGTRVPGYSRVRVLEVVIEPRTREPEQTHQEVSVMIIEEPARIRYYAGGTLRFESQQRSGSPPGVRVRWMEPEGPHSVENTDEHRYHAIRVELR